MCGARLSAPTSLFALAPPLPCAALSASALNQAVLHMQFTKAETRRDILDAMGWWHEPPEAAPNGAACVALGSLAAGTLSAVAVSSSSMNSTLLCVLAGTWSGHDQAMDASKGTRGAACPCCWRVAELELAAAQTGTESVETLKALRRAAMWTGCRLWRQDA